MKCFVVSLVWMAKILKYACGNLRNFNEEVRKYKHLKDGCISFSKDEL